MYALSKNINQFINNPYIYTRNFLYQNGGLPELEKLEATSIWCQLVEICRLHTFLCVRRPKAAAKIWAFFLVNVLTGSLTVTLPQRISVYHKITGVKKSSLEDNEMT